MCHIKATVRGAPGAPGSCTGCVRTLDRNTAESGRPGPPWGPSGAACGHLGTPLLSVCWEDGNKDSLVHRAPVGTAGSFRGGVPAGTASSLRCGVWCKTEGGAPCPSALKNFTAATESSAKHGALPRVRRLVTTPRSCAREPAAPTVERRERGQTFPWDLLCQVTRAHHLISP